MSSVLIKNGRVIDPASGFDRVADVYVADGKIAAVGEAPAGFVADETLEASGRLVLPGLVDVAARRLGTAPQQPLDALEYARQSYDRPADMAHRHGRQIDVVGRVNTSQAAPASALIRRWARMLRWLTSTPLGRPVVPEV